MSKILITGDSGFVGRHLTLLFSDDEWYGFDLNYDLDLRNYEQVRLAIDEFRPDYIYHLAAQAYIPESFANPIRTFEVNTIGSINLLEAVRQVGIKPKILLAGTSEEYSDTEEEPITELSVPKPLSPYAVSKLAMDLMGQLYAQSYGMHIVTTRTFNHTGPGRGEMYAESSFAKQIAQIELGQRDTLEHGNLESIRNYTDVRDIVRAYKLAIELPSGIYNICSEVNVSIEKVLAMLKAHASSPILTQQQDSLLRLNDFSFKRPSSKKFRDLTGWEPTIGFDKTLLDLLNYWRKQCSV